MAARAGQRAESSVAVVPPGASGDLRHLRRGQPALALAVELRQASEGNMIEVEVEPHADRVGGDKVIDLARLEHGDLLVACFRAERAHNHRRAAAKPAQQLGHGIDLLGTEGDDGAARRYPAELLRSGMA